MPDTPDQLSLQNNVNLTPAKTPTSKAPYASACLRCRQLHLKCDGTIPSCLRCVQLNTTCDYYARRRGYKTGLRKSTPVAQLELGHRRCERCGGLVDVGHNVSCPNCFPPAHVEIIVHDREGDSQSQATTTQAEFSTLPTTHEPPETSSVEINEQASGTTRTSIDGPQNVPATLGSQWQFCHIAIAIGCLTFSGSLALALWWSFTRNDVSGGFTMAAYIVAVGGLPLASIQMRHNQKCNCWKKDHDRDIDMGSL